MKRSLAACAVVLWAGLEPGAARAAAVQGNQSFYLADRASQAFSVHVEYPVRFTLQLTWKGPETVDLRIEGEPSEHEGGGRGVLLSQRVQGAPAAGCSGCYAGGVIVRWDRAGVIHVVMRNESASPLQGQLSWRVKDPSPVRGAAARPARTVLTAPDNLSWTVLWEGGAITTEVLDPLKEKVTGRLVDGGGSVVSTWARKATVEEMGRVSPVRPPEGTERLPAGQASPPASDSPLPEETRR